MQDRSSVPPPVPIRVPLPNITPPRSREAHKLRVARQSIRPDVVLLEAILHVQPSRLVKVHALPLHDGLHLALPRIVEALSRVASFEICVEIEGGGGEAGFDVVAEGGGEARVDGFGDG